MKRKLKNKREQETKKCTALKINLRLERVCLLAHNWNVCESWLAEIKFDLKH